MKENEILELERIRNEILKKKKKYDYSYVLYIVLLVTHLFLFIKIVSIYYTYNNDDFVDCFNQSFSHFVKSEYLSENNVATIQSNLPKITNMCNYKKIRYTSSGANRLGNSLLFYNKGANTYIDYTIAFHKLLSSEIFQVQTSMSITHYYHWEEWTQHLALSIVTFAIIYRDWAIKEKLKNTLHVCIAIPFHTNILYQQFVDSIENDSVQEKFLEFLIHAYYIFIIINIFKTISKKLKMFMIPVKIVDHTVRHNYTLLAFLSSFLVLTFVNYILSMEKVVLNCDKKWNSYFKSVYTFSDSSKYKNEFIYSFSFTLIYHFFFIPMIIILSSATTFLIIHKNSDIFNVKAIKNPLWDRLKKYVFFLKEEKYLVRDEIDIEKNANKNGENIHEESGESYEAYEQYEVNMIKGGLLRIASIIIFFFLLVLFFVKIFFEQNAMAHIDVNFTQLLREPFVTRTDEEKSFDTLVSPSEYFDFLNGVMINNIMRNKKNLGNKKVYDLEANFSGHDIFMYENFFHVFPYDIYIALRNGHTELGELTVDNPLLSGELITQERELDQHKDLFDYPHEGIQCYDAYSILYSFENNLLVLINTSFNAEKNGQFRKGKEIFVHEMSRFDSSEYTSKLVILISLLIVTAAYFVVIMYMLYYVRNKYFLTFFGFFFLICIFFFTFNFMTLKSLRYSCDYIDQIKKKNISDTFNLNKLGKFKTLIQDLLKSSTISEINKNFLTWVMLFYHIQANEKISAYQFVITFVFFFFLYYITSIYLYIFLKKSEHVVKVKLDKNDDPLYLPFDDMDIDDHDVLLYFKSVLYSIDKIFEKIRILKEKYKISQVINQQIQWYNNYCYQRTIQNNFLNVQKQLRNSYEHNRNVMQDGQFVNLRDSCYGAVVSGQENQHRDENGKGVSTHKVGGYAVDKSADGVKEIGNLENYDHVHNKIGDYPMDGRMAKGKSANEQMVNEQVMKNRHGINMESDTVEELKNSKSCVNSVFVEKDNMSKEARYYNDLEIVTKAENMFFFFTKLMNEKYDFHFLHDEDEENVQSGCFHESSKRKQKRKAALVSFLKKGMQDKSALSRREKVKKKKRSVLKKMLTSLYSDIGYIENIKITYTYILFLKIKRHILLKKIDELQYAKRELKSEYQNKVLYKNHLFNLRKKLSEQRENLEKSIIIGNKLKSTIIHVIEDGVFYKREDVKSDTKQESLLIEEAKCEGGVFGEPILPDGNEE
ncbi:conserved Plasmodium protein, unknown function [Plasmodium ovale]|uniref:Uncharacterized protein n=1 Tax=Plasmodium ovale TaxID=36330 RepID=A0A1C3KQ05_PLAOA|nr:conserved Plasmodium protein, unknown function [Plasmodium ovale]